MKTQDLSEDKKNELLLIRAQADAFDCVTLGKHLTNLDAKAPGTGNKISDPYPFNMMFSTQIGPGGKSKGYTYFVIANLTNYL